MKRSIVTSLIVFLFALITINTPAQQQPPPPEQRPAYPGSVNYIEGAASIDGAPLSTSSVGSATLAAGQSLTTQNGKVEILLTPGVFLRVAPNSEVKMVSPNLTNTEVSVVRGRAMVEAVDVRKENNIRIDVDDAYATIVKNGIYDFDADTHQVRTFKGEAEVTVNGQKSKVGSSHMLTLNAPGKLKAKDFDTRAYEDDFFRWSAVRSAYLSEATADVARAYIGSGPGWYGPGWYGSGWYWDPWWSVWTFLPADGVFYSPFGWGFYSPIWIYHSPYFYGGYWGHPAHPFGEYHGPFGHGIGEPRGGFRGGGFGGPGAGARGGGGRR